MLRLPRLWRRRDARTVFLVLALSYVLSGCASSAPTAARVPTTTAAPDSPALTGGPRETPTTAAPSARATSTGTAAESALYDVTEVVDGDTIKVRRPGGIETIRLIGLDTPEVVDPRTPVQCYGREASARAKDLLTGQRVRIEQDPTQDTRDVYGRLLAYAWREDGLFFNLQMIADGYAHEYAYRDPYRYQAEFKAAERRAQAEQLGLWSPATCNGNTKQPAVPGTPATPALTATQQSGGAAPFYANCAAARAAGVAPLRRGQPGYREALDGDHDGVACE